MNAGMLASLDCDHFGFRRSKHQWYRSMSDAVIVTKCEQCVIRTLSEAAAFFNTLLEELRLLAYSDKELFGIRLAVEEVIVNAIKHGNGEDPLKTVQISYTASPRQFMIEIKDEGDGFDPRCVLDPVDPANIERPGGRGVYLAKRFMTWVRYNDVGNCVTLCKVR